MAKLKNFMMLMLLMIISISVANGGEVLYDQTQVLTNKNTDNVGGTQLFDLVGSLNSESIGNKTGDIKLEFSSVENDYYFYFANTIINNTINITWFFDDSNFSTTQELTMEEKGNYYFQIQPDFTGEGGSVMIEAENSFVTQLYLQESQPRGFSSVLETFVNGFTEIIEININIWRVTFYTFLFAITLGIVYVIFSVSFKVFEYSKKLRDGNGIHENHWHRENKSNKGDK